MNLVPRRRRRLPVLIACPTCLPAPHSAPPAFPLISPPVGRVLFYFFGPGFLCFRLFLLGSRWNRFLQLTDGDPCLPEARVLSFRRGARRVHQSCGVCVTRRGTRTHSTSKAASARKKFRRAVRDSLQIRSRTCGKK